MTNRVLVDKPLTVSSVNGPLFTTIQGRQVPGITNGDGAIRGVYLTNGASLFGFTITNGATRAVFSFTDRTETSGGGIWCESTDVIVSDCVLVGNSARRSGGGIYRGTLYSCVLTNNTVTEEFNAGGGGAAFSDLVDCIVARNSSAFGAGGVIGGLFNVLSNCFLLNNSSVGTGGGAYGVTLINCTLLSNSAQVGGGVFGGAMNNCLVQSNSVSDSGGGSFRSLLNNCTIVGNSAVGYAGGVYDGNFEQSTRNCIIYYNTAPTEPDYKGFGPDLPTYCCMPPIPPLGNGTITNQPKFIDLVGGNLRLQPDSPCINAGHNSFVTNSSDLDGSPRIVGGTVDIGAYEFQAPASVLSYAWAQQHGLPTDGSADFTDTDGDGMNNWNEYRADTVPTNTLSVLRMVNATNSPTGAKVTWQSVSTRNYWLERATNLGTPAPFQVVATNISGAPGTRAFTDSSATNGGLNLYRVGVH